MAKYGRKLSDGSAKVVLDVADAKFDPDEEGRKTAERPRRGSSESPSMRRGLNVDGTLNAGKPIVSNAARENVSLHPGAKAGVVKSSSRC